jgi:uncharacterized protein (DUF305 family)
MTDRRERPILRAVLLTVIAVGLIGVGGGLSVLVGVGGDAPARPTEDSVEVGFARDMSEHHLQAVLMANLAPSRSSDPEVRQIAFDIASTQLNQVGRMQGWLTLWGWSLSGPHDMAWMGSAPMEGTDAHAGSSPMGAAAMPGMATGVELDELRGLSGAAFDVRFLQLMVRHHEGGAGMARYAAEHAELPVLRGLARMISETQAAESQTMVAMLTARGAQPLEGR